MSPGQVVKLFLEFGLLPLVWGGVVWSVHYFGWVRGGRVPSDRIEKMFLAILLAPYGLGLMLFGLAAFLPSHAPVLPPILPESVIAPQPTILSTPSAVQPVTQGLDLIGLGAMELTILTIFALLGSVFKTLRLIIAHIRLDRRVARAKPCPTHGQTVLISSDIDTAMAWTKARIILPEGLVNALSSHKIEMIIAHERAHIQRGDVFYFMGLAMVDAVFWFNPFVVRQTQMCRTAAELACDTLIISDQSEISKAYAETLVEALKWSAGDVQPYAPAVFSNVNSGELRMRIEQILKPNPDPIKPKPWMWGLLAALILPIGTAQWALAQDGSKMAAEAAAGKTNQGIDSGAAGDGTVSKIYRDEIGGSMDALTQKMTKGFWVVEVDHGGGIYSVYRSSFDQPIIKMSDHIAFGQKIFPDTSSSEGIVMTTMCMPKAELDSECYLQGKNGQDLGGPGVMWGNVTYRSAQHIIHADVVLQKGPKGRELEFHDHVRVEMVTGTYPLAKASVEHAHASELTAKARADQATEKARAAKLTNESTAQH